MQICQNQSVDMKRHGCFECSRAICMLWIVCIWHGRGYIIDFPWSLSQPIFGDITGGALSTFVFISGYFLGKKRFNSLNDVIAFYKRRFFHLYLPFFLSCSLMLLMFYLYGTPYIRTVKQYFLSLTGLSLLIPPAPSTVWFVVFIIPCYLITPFLVRSKNRVLACLITYSCAVVIQAALKQYFAIDSDERILLYLPFFFVGLCIPHSINEDFSHAKLFLFLTIIVLLEVFGIHRSSTFKYALLGSIVVVFLEIGKLINCNNVLLKMGMAIGTISMLAYLFHRQYLFVVKLILGDVNMLQMYILIFPLFFMILFLINHYLLKSLFPRK